MTGALPFLVSLLAACGASPSPAPPFAPWPPPAPPPVATPASESYQPAEQQAQPEQRALAYQEQVTRLDDSAAGACSSAAGALCSLSGCGDGKTLCEYVTTDVKPFVRRVIRHKEALFMRCYQDYRSVEPNAEGTVQTWFTVDAGGVVVTARATGIHSTIDACVASALQTLTFPELRGHTTNVVYPFVFVRQP